MSWKKYVPVVLSSILDAIYLIKKSNFLSLLLSKEALTFANSSWLKVKRNLWFYVMVHLTI